MRVGAAVEGLLRILCNVHSGGLHGLDANDFPHTHTHTPQGTIIPSILPHCPFSFPPPPLSYRCCRHRSHGRAPHRLEGGTRRRHGPQHCDPRREAARGEGLCVCVMCGGWVDENDEWGKRWTCLELGPFWVVGRKERGRQVGQWCSSEWLGDVSRSAPPPSPSAAWYSIRPPPSPVTAGFRLPSQDRCRTPHSVQPHGVQRPGDCGPEWSACTWPLPCRRLGEI